MTVDPAGAKSLPFEFKRLSNNISIDVQSMVAAVQQLEQAYDVINDTILNILNAYDTHNIIKMGLMKSVLEREIYKLFSEISKLKDALAESIRMLIGTAATVLSQVCIASVPFSEDDAGVINAKIAIVEGIAELKRLQARLSIGWGRSGGI